CPLVVAATMVVVFLAAVSASLSAWFAEAQGTLPPARQGTGGWPGSPRGPILAVAFGADARPVSGAGSLVLRPLVRLRWGAFSAHPLVTAACRALHVRGGSRLDG